MNLSEIKSLVKQNGDKFVLVENGEPEVVMMSFREYQKLAQYGSNIRIRSNDPNDDSRSSTEYLDNSDVEFQPQRGETGSEWSGGSFRSSSEVVGLPVRLEDIRLEDLPI